MPNSELIVQNELLTAHRTIGKRYIPLEDLQNCEDERLTCQGCTYNSESKEMNAIPRP